MSSLKLFGKKFQNSLACWIMVSCHMLPHVAMFVVKIYLIFTVSKCKYIYICMWCIYIYQTWSLGLLMLWNRLCFTEGSSQDQNVVMKATVLSSQKMQFGEKLQFTQNHVESCLQMFAVKAGNTHLKTFCRIRIYKQIRCSKDQRPKSLMMLHRWLWLCDLKCLLWIALCIHYRLWKKKSCTI